jgi:hypothetical protein
VSLTVTVGLSAGCGSSGSDQGDEKVDAGAGDSTSSSSGGGTESGSGSGSSGASSGDSGSPSPGSGTLTGPQGFSVRWAWMDPSEPAEQCGADAVPDGGFAATSILLFENDESSLACGDGGLNSGGTGRFIDIEVATAQYAMQAPVQAPQPTQALSPGTYAILNEGEDDEDLCSVQQSSPTAILQVLEFGLYDAQEIAISGTVTVDSVGPHAIAGSFDVLLGGPYGLTDGGAGQPLSGSFNAVTCP